MAHGGVGTATAAAAAGGSRVPERALVLVDISNSYVISWVLLGAPESCYYLPLLSSANADTRGEEGCPSTHAACSALSLSLSLSFCSCARVAALFPAEFFAPGIARVIATDNCAEGCGGGLWGFYDTGVQPVA
jgi:hypothetical protein